MWISQKSWKWQKRCNAHWPLPTGCQSFPPSIVVTPKNVSRYFQVPPGRQDCSGWKITDLEQCSLWAILLVRRQIGNNGGLCGSDNVKNSRGESHQSEWYSKSENVGKIHCNKEIESLGGFLPTTGSFKYIKISHPTSNKGFQIWVPKTRLLMVYAFIPPSNQTVEGVCELSGGKHKPEPANLACLSRLNWPGFFMRCLSAWVLNFILLFYVVGAYA